MHVCKVPSYRTLISIHFCTMEKTSISFKNDSKLSWNNLLKITFFKKRILEFQIQESIVEIYDF